MINKRLFYSVAKSFLIKNPVYSHYFITNKCNFKCKMCDIYNHPSSGELSIKSIEKLVPVLKRLQVGIVNLCGGEPLIRKDLAEIVMLFSRKGFYVRLQTNGTLATRGLVKDLAGAGLVGVSVSLKTLDSKLEDEICGSRGVWEKIIRGISLFSEFLPRIGSLCMINTLISKKNINEFPKLIRFADRIGWKINFIPIHTHNAVLFERAPELDFSSKEHGVLGDAISGITRMKREGCSISNSIQHLKASEKFIKNRKLKWKCNAGRRYFAITHDGYFMPCQNYLYRENVLDGDFLRVYNSQEFRKKLKRDALKCNGCAINCCFEIDNFFRPPQAFNRAKEWVRNLSKRPLLSYGQMRELIDQINKAPTSTLH